MAKISILSGDPKTGDLVLSDKGFSKVDKGGPVLWKIEKDSGVGDIIDITMKSTPSSTNIFSSGPERDGHSTNWKGKVSPGAETDAEYDYNIYWIPDGGKDTLQYDPKLKVNP